MAGLIVGFYGYQRSGKTLLAYKIAKSYTKRGLVCYTNMIVSDPGFVTIKSLSDMPLNTKPKVLLLDEVYSFMDSRNWRNNSNASLFFNTLGKQSCLLLLTAISPDMVEMRLRNQQSYMIIAKGDNEKIKYRLIDCQRLTTSDFVLPKDEKLFADCNYDTLQVPDIVDCNMSDFADRVKAYNQRQQSTR